ncbi:MAG: alpha/beta fold hydrolase, partial [Gemmatimonadetes bacterium]|nr:alpha/beta fold hydrolase [Gemmatimonadota bacterium]
MPPILTATYLRSFMTTTVQTRQLELDGFSVQLREAGVGAGPPVLCLHGGPGMDAAYFFPPDRFGPGLQELAQHHHVIAYDQRGCGGSGVPDVKQPLALSRHVDDIDAVRRALGLDTVALLGHSFGTVLALLYALRHGDSLSHLILIGGAPDRGFMDGYREAVQELPLAAQQRLAELDRTELTDEVFRQRFLSTLPLYFHRALEPEDAEAFIEATSFSARVNRSIAVDLQSYDLAPALPNVRAPALVVYGESDRVVQPRYQLQFRGSLLTSRFVAF